MNFKSIEFSLPDAKEKTNTFRPRVGKQTDKKNNFFIFGKTSKQSDFNILKSPKLKKRQSNKNFDSKEIEFSGENAKTVRPKSSYIMKKKVWIDNRNKTKTSKKLIDTK